MKKANAAVAVISHKDRPDDEEVGAMEQCFRVLKDYPIYLIVPAEIDHTFYRERFSRGILTPVRDFLLTLKGYNLFKISPAFYRIFRDFDFVLTYEPDAWVFRDDLASWCRSGFDFIGAPWFDSTEPGKAPRLTYVGNSGFSLRKVSTFRRWFTVVHRLEILEKRIQQHGSWVALFRMRALYRDMLHADEHTGLVDSLTRRDGMVSEDNFWCGSATIDYRRFFKRLHLRCLPYFPLLLWRLKRPSPRKAALFSFEVHPEILYEITGHRLPFGCHAWKKWSPEFWKEHIPLGRG